VLDPIVAAATVGVVVSPAAGTLVLRGFDGVPAHRRRAAAWMAVAGACCATGVATQLGTSRLAEWLFIALLGAVPGVLAFLVFRTATASALVSLVPMYFGIGAMTLGRPLHLPVTALDRALPLESAWMLVYASMYVFAFLPLLVARDGELRHRAARAYVTVLVVAYAGFILYPTVGPRPDVVVGDGFAAWALRLQYSLDWPYNCFPSLHVAHSFVSALTTYRVHKSVGWAALVWAFLIGISTLFTKQHYAVDVVGGMLAAYAAYLIFLRGYPREAVCGIDYRQAPRRALGFVAIFVVFIAGMWLMYRVTGIV
jgi:membrane-associated phospholipid phosphatase